MHSESCASFSSISSSGFKRENVKSLGHQSYDVKTGQFNVINARDWLQPLTHGIEKQTFSFFQNEWDRPKKSLFQKPSGLVVLEKFGKKDFYIKKEEIVK
ncbi:hypothetical protein HDU91_004670 [Kappamyces sp. JEL0680]|nr:hypothetical protein HDU91_004670 [Kappamyces sp. JEL0680]